MTASSMPGGLPRRDGSSFLDRPAVAVRMVEERETRAGRALGSELLHIADADAAIGERLAHRIEVIDDEVDALDGARLSHEPVLVRRSMSTRSLASRGWNDCGSSTTGEASASSR